MDISAVIQIVLAIGGGASLIGLIKVRADKKKILSEANKTDADSLAVISGAAISLVEPQNAQVIVLQHRLDGANSQIEELYKKLREFRAEAERDLDELSRKLREANRRADVAENKYNDMLHEHTLMQNRLAAEER